MQDVTLESLRTKVRASSDMENTDFISDSFLTARINANLADVYDILVNSFEDFFVIDIINEWVDPIETPFYLPLDFYKLVRVAVTNSNGDYVEIKHINTLEDVSTGTISSNTDLKYRLRGNALYFLNKPNPGYLFIEYVPMFKYLEDPLDEVPWKIPVGWENYTIYKTCADCMAKEESDPTYWLQRAMETKAEIIEHTFRRDNTWDQTWTDTEGALD